MQTKTFFSASIALLISLAVTAQTDRQPFADIGKKVKVLTLTNGKYEEFFDDDSLQRIGTALVNIYTMMVVKLQLTDEEQRIMDNAVTSRFLSVDPLSSSFAYLTPYQYASNTPIQAIDLDGLEATYNKQNNVYFITLKNVDVSFVIRQSEKTFTQSAIAKNSSWTDITVNTQQYETTSLSAKASYALGPSSPQPSSDYRAQGYTVDMGKNVAGRSSPESFYFSQSSANCSWTCGQGDVPENSYTGFGGGIPVYVNGLKYGNKNVYSSDAPANLPAIGDPGADNRKYLVQRSSTGYAKQNDQAIGKTIIGYNSKTNDWTVVVQQNGSAGMTLDAIRDNLISKGYTNILSFDGSTSSTLVQDNKIIVTPDTRKNNTITTGATFTVPVN